MSQLITSVVRIADTITNSLKIQGPVTHKMWVSQDSFGAVVYRAETRQALVEKRPQRVKTNDGQIVMSRATVTFLRPVLVNPLDKITLADGGSWPVLATDGFVNGGSATGSVYLISIYLG